AFGLARTLDPLFTVTFRVQKEDNTPGRYRLLGIDTFEYGGSSDTIRDYFHLVKGVWEANRFDAENPENGVQAGTTLYWNHLIITDEDGNATVKLNTGAL